MPERTQAVVAMFPLLRVLGRAAVAEEVEEVVEETQCVLEVVEEEVK